MAEGKRIRRFWWLMSWQIGEIESWLSDMAAKGWHFSHCGTLFAVFIQGEPKQVRYRCDVVESRNPELSERIEYYQGAGWEYKCSRQNLHVFRATDDKVIEAPQEHRHATTLLERQLLITVVTLGLWTVLLGLIFPLRMFNVFRISILLTNSSSTWLLPLVYLYILFLGIWSCICANRLLAKVRRGLPYSQQNKPYRRTLLLNKIGGMLLLAFIVAFLIESSTFKEHTAPLPLPEGNYPVIRISQIIPDARVVSRGTSYQTDSSLLVPKQWSFREYALVTGELYEIEYTPTLYLVGFKARTEWLAWQLAKGLSRDLAEMFPSRLSPRKLLNRLYVESSSFDGLWCFESQSGHEFIALQGKYVIHLKYDGEEPITGLLELVKEKLDSLD